MKRRASFPNYRLVDREAIGTLNSRMKRLGRLYWKAQKHAWDGPTVLDGLLKKHGGIQVPDDIRASLGKIFAIILWGELAAWKVSVELAEMSDQPELKMALTAQAFDEARHFYVMRDYLLELGGEIPHLDNFIETTLTVLIESKVMSHKVVGTQLLVENVALMLFKRIAEQRIEPVLADLLPFFSRDEARHVAVGALCLPDLLLKMGPTDTLQLWFFQVSMIYCIAASAMSQADHFKAVGMDLNDLLQVLLRFQRELMHKIVATPEEKKRIGRAIWTFEDLAEYSIVGDLEATVNFLDPNRRNDLNFVERFGTRLLDGLNRRMHGLLGYALRVRRFVPTMN